MKKLLLFSLLLTFLACSDDNDTPDPKTDRDFDRQLMLTNWADNLIIPAFDAFSVEMDDLKTMAVNFTASPDQMSLEALRTAWLDAYMVWQSVSMFELGRAEAIGFRANMNIYPADASGIDQNILNDQSYNLALPSERDKQGFPALDYLLYGIADSDDTILAMYESDANAERYRAYLIDVVNRMDELTKEVVADWQGGFRDEFINNTGNSSTASVDKFVNDYIFYYEKALRAGKVGIPAGVFSGQPLATHVEAPYSAVFSKQLLIEAIDATQDFFNGVHYNSTTSGEGLKSYLDFLNTMKNGADLSALINAQFEAARTQANTLNDNFVQQIEDNNMAMLATFDQLQLNVVLLKVDMLQAMNINVDFVDADGD